jgi:hypothetical protein
LAKPEEVSNKATAARAVTDKPGATAADTICQGRWGWVLLFPQACIGMPLLPPLCWTLPWFGQTTGGVQQSNSSKGRHRPTSSNSNILSSALPPPKPLSCHIW